MDQPFMKPGSQRSLPTTEFWIFFLNLYHQYWGQDSAVGIVICYRLDGPGIEIPVAERFSTCIQTSPGAQPASCTMRTGSFPQAKQPRWGIDHPPPSTAEVKETVELYLYSSSGTSWPVLERTIRTDNMWENLRLKGTFEIFYVWHWYSCGKVFNNIKILN
jgi:hypothetical protein